MGTLIQSYGLTERDFHNSMLGGSDWKTGITPTAVPLKGNNDVLNLTRPDVIADIHFRNSKVIKPILIKERLSIVIRIIVRCRIIQGL